MTENNRIEYEASWTKGTEENSWDMIDASRVTSDVPEAEIKNSSVSTGDYVVLTEDGEEEVIGTVSEVSIGFSDEDEREAVEDSSDVDFIEEGTLYVGIE